MGPKQPGWPQLRLQAAPSRMLTAASLGTPETGLLSAQAATVLPQVSDQTQGQNGVPRMSTPALHLLLSLGTLLSLDLGQDVEGRPSPC